AIERKRTGVSDLQIEQLTHVPPGSLKDHNLVRARATFETRRIPAARSLHQDLRPSANPAPILLFADLIYQVQQPAMALPDDFRRHRIRHRRGRRGPARRIFENKRIVEFHLAHQRKRLLEILLALSWESDND